MTCPICGLPACSTGSDPSTTGEYTDDAFLLWSLVHQRHEADEWPSDDNIALALIDASSIAMRHGIHEPSTPTMIKWAARALYFKFPFGVTKQ